MAHAQKHSHKDSCEDYACSLKLILVVIYLLNFAAERQQKPLALKALCKAIFLNCVLFFKFSRFRKPSALSLCRGCLVNNTMKLIILLGIILAIATSTLKAAPLQNLSGMFQCGVRCVCVWANILNYITMMMMIPITLQHRNSQ